MPCWRHPDYLDEDKSDDDDDDDNGHFKYTYINGEKVMFRQMQSHTYLSRNLHIAAGLRRQK